MQTPTYEIKTLAESYSISNGEHRCSGCCAKFVHGETFEIGWVLLPNGTQVLINVHPNENCRKVGISRESQ
jgi:hypothetical protein